MLNDLQQKSEILFNLTAAVAVSHMMLILLATSDYTLTSSSITFSMLF